MATLSASSLLSHVRGEGHNFKARSRILALESLSVSSWVMWGYTAQTLFEDFELSVRFLQEEEHGEAHNVSEFSSRVACYRLRTWSISGMAMNAFIPSVVLHVSSLCNLSTSVMLEARSEFCGLHDGTLQHVVQMMP